MLKDIVDFNPSEPLKRGTVTKKIGMADIIEHQRSIPSYEEAKYTSGTRFRNGDTLFARITPSLENGKIAQVNILDEDEVGFGSTEFIVWRYKDNISDPNFLFYLANYRPIIDAAIKSMVGTSGRQRVQLDVLQNYQYTCPPLSTQKAIADTLSCLDAKIEVNNRIIKNLEEQAQAIFKSWFIDFEPFQEGEFIESELGMIPEGWNAGTIADLGEVVGGSTPSKKFTEYYSENGIAWITPKDLSLNKNKFVAKGQIDITQLGLKNSSAKVMPKGTVLFSSRAPIGYIAIAKNEVTTNQGFKSVVPREDVGTEYVYHFLKNNVSTIEAVAGGSTFKEVSGTTMKQIPALIPSKRVLEEFKKAIHLHFQLQELLEEQNTILATLRDTLLPKLMSGEIEVPIDQ